MTSNATAPHRYRIGQICIFTNRGMSGITSNDGKRCKIVRLKPAKEWVRSEPEYAMQFLDDDHGFGVRECELEPTR